MSEVTASPLLCSFCHASVPVGEAELGNKQWSSSAL